MCGGIYEDDFTKDSEVAPGKDKADAKKAKQSAVGSEQGGMMGDLKFTTAGDYIDYYYPGSDPQE